MIYQGKQKIWSEYQKEIPDDKWFYVRSCIRQNFFPASERMFMEICRDILKKDFYETEHHTTCGGIAYHCDTIPQETAMTIVARQFALMTEAGYENYVASCITSFGNYTEILQTWEEFPELETRIREMLWKACRKEFNKPKYIAHASDLIYKYRNLIAGSWSTSAAIMPRCSRQKVWEEQNILTCSQAWLRHGEAMSLTTLSAGTAADTDSGSTTSRPTGVIPSPIRTRSSSLWSLTGRT